MRFPDLQPEPCRLWCSKVNQERKLEYRTWHLFHCMVLLVSGAITNDHIRRRHSVKAPTVYTLQATRQTDLQPSLVVCSRLQCSLDYVGGL
jgi:hypothetical protein